MNGVAYRLNRPAQRCQHRNHERRRRHSRQRGMSRRSLYLSDTMCTYLNRSFTTLCGEAFDQRIQRVDNASVSTACQSLDGVHRGCRTQQLSYYSPHTHNVAVQQTTLDNPPEPLLYVETPCSQRRGVYHTDCRILPRSEPLTLHIPRSAVSIRINSALVLKFGM